MKIMLEWRRKLYGFMRESRLLRIMDDYIVSLYLHFHDWMVPINIDFVIVEGRLI